MVKSVGRVGLSHKHGVFLAGARIVVSAESANLFEVAGLCQFEHQPIAAAIASESLAVILGFTAAGTVARGAVEKRAGVVTTPGMRAVVFSVGQKAMQQIGFHDIRLAITGRNLAGAAACGYSFSLNLR